MIAPTHPEMASSLSLSTVRWLMTHLPGVHVSDYPDFSDCLSRHFAGLQGVRDHANDAAFP